MLYAALWPEGLGRWPPPHVPLRVRLESRALARGCLWTGRGVAETRQHAKIRPSTQAGGGTRGVCSGLAPRPSAADLRPSSRRTGPVQEPSGRRQDL